MFQVKQWTPKEGLLARLSDKASDLNMFKYKYSNRTTVLERFSGIHTVGNPKVYLPGSNKMKIRFNKYKQIFF